MLHKQAHTEICILKFSNTKSLAGGIISSFRFLCFYHFVIHLRLFCYNEPEWCITKQLKGKTCPCQPNKSLHRAKISAEL